MAIRPFTDGDVDAAAELLAERHARHRAAEPLVPHPAAPSGQGVVAVDDGDVVGYLLGELRDGAPFGRHVWVGEAGVVAREPELVRDLYAAAAQEWVDGGYSRHFVLTPALGDQVEAWFALGFGQQQVHAVRGPRRPSSTPRRRSGR